MLVNKLLTCCYDHWGHAPLLKGGVGVLLGSARTAGLTPTAYWWPPNIQSRWRSRSRSRNVLVTSFWFYCSIIVQPSVPHTDYYAGFFWFIIQRNIRPAEAELFKVNNFQLLCASSLYLFLFLRCPPNLTFNLKKNKTKQNLSSKQFSGLTLGSTQRQPFSFLVPFLPEGG